MVDSEPPEQTSRKNLRSLYPAILSKHGLRSMLRYMFLWFYAFSDTG